MEALKVEGDETADPVVEATPNTVAMATSSGPSVEEAEGAGTGTPNEIHAPESLQMNENLSLLLIFPAAAEVISA